LRSAPRSSRRPPWRGAARPPTSAASRSSRSRTSGGAVAGAPESRLFARVLLDRERALHASGRVAGKRAHELVLALLQRCLQRVRLPGLQGHRLLPGDLEVVAEATLVDDLERGRALHDRL